MTPRDVSTSPKAKAIRPERQHQCGARDALKARAECFVAGLLDSVVAPTDTWDFVDIDHIDFDDLDAGPATCCSVNRAGELAKGLSTLTVADQRPDAPLGKTSAQLCAGSQS